MLVVVGVVLLVLKVLAVVVAGVLVVWHQPLLEQQTQVVVGVVFTTIALALLAGLVS
jgi:hypothetical protein